MGTGDLHDHIGYGLTALIDGANGDPWHPSPDSETKPHMVPGSAFVQVQSLRFRPRVLGLKDAIRFEIPKVVDHCYTETTGGGILD